MKMLFAYYFIGLITLQVFISQIFHIFDKYKISKFLNNF